MVQWCSREGEPSPDPARWTYRPKLARTLSFDETRAVRGRLAAALRVAHGLGVEFALSVVGGIEPAVELEVPGRDGRRWVERVLVRAYGEGRWSRASWSASPTSVAVWYGRRSRPWPTPLYAPADGASITEVVAMGFSALRPTVRLDARFSPLQPVVPSWWERERHDPELGPPGLPRRSPEWRRGPEPAVLPALEAQRPPFWTASFSLTDLGIDAGSTARLVEAARSLERATRGPTGGGLLFRRPATFPPRGSPRVILSEEETVTWLPVGETSVPIAPVARSSTATLLPVGRTREGRVVGPAVEAGQGRHLVVLGETGMGKSSLLLALARRVARTHGVLLLDPLGDTARAFESELEPGSRNRLVRISPQRSRVGTNALDGIGSDSDPVRSERRLSDLVFALRRVRAGRYVESSFWGPRLEEMLTRALRAAAVWPNGTLVDAHTLLATGARLHREVPATSMGTVRELADRVRERPEDGEGARRLLYEVVRSPVLEQMLCARTPELAPRELVAPGAIVVISGDAAQVGESAARYLLSVYLALVWSELLARPQAPKTFVVLDEAQWFSHESLAEMLRLGRRANVHVVLATQAIASLPAAVAEAVWTNVADFVAFRGSPDEARELSRMSREIAPESVVALPRGRAVVLLGKGETVRWVQTVRIPLADRAGAASLREEGNGGTSVGARPETYGSDGERVSPGGAPEVQSVLAEVERIAAAQTRGPTVRISLNALRRAVDPDGRAVRSAGAALGRAGLIVGTERTADGAVWVLRRDRTNVPAERATAEPVTPRSDSTQPS